MRTRYDEGWKEVIETFFPQFLYFFFPRIAQGIDFGKGYAFLDKELGRISKKGLGGRRVDKLVRIYRKDGDEQWLLVHIEMQGYPQKNFVSRMYVYNYRIFNRYNRDVVSLAVLTDEDERFRPRVYRFEFGDFRLEINPVRHSCCFSRLGEIFSSGSRDVFFCELHFWAFPKRNCGLRGDSSVR